LLEIGINEFCQIASEEDVIDERELIKAFRSIDTNQNGYIEYREFMEIFGNVYNNFV
jgi:Ca2+-binding EF-hand superfamily protein